MGWVPRMALSHIWTCIAGWASGRSVDGQNLGCQRKAEVKSRHSSPCPLPKPQDLQVGFEEEPKFLPVTELRNPYLCSHPREQDPMPCLSLLSGHSRKLPKS